MCFNDIYNYDIRITYKYLFHIKVHTHIYIYIDTPSIIVNIIYIQE